MFSWSVRQENNTPPIDLPRLSISYYNNVLFSVGTILRHLTCIYLMYLWISTQITYFRTPQYIFTHTTQYDSKYNKNAFQSKAHLLLVDRKSNTYNLTLEWHWPWYDLDLIYDLDLRQVKLSLTDAQIAKLVFSMRWPWPWPNDLDTLSLPRYDQDVTPYQIWSFYVNWSKKYSPNTDTHTYTHTRTHRHTDMTKTLPLPHTPEVTSSTVTRKTLLVSENATRTIWMVKTTHHTIKEFNVGKAWSKWESSFCVNRWWGEELKINILQSMWIGECLGWWWGRGTWINNRHGEDWQSAFHYPCEFLIANQQSWKGPWELCSSTISVRSTGLQLVLLIVSFYVSWKPCN